MATANKMCRLLITAQPMVSIVLPTVMTTPISAPAICTSLPTLIISPAAGITAITVISTLPSFCKKSKLIMDFFFFFSIWFPAFPSRPSPAALPPPAVSAPVPTLSSPPHSSSTVIMVVSPAFTAPNSAFMARPSIPPQISTGVMVSTCLSFSPSRSASATRSPAFTWSPTFTWHLKNSPLSATVSNPKCTNTSTPSRLRNPYACSVSATDTTSPSTGLTIRPSSGATATPSPIIFWENTGSGT